MLAGRMKLRNFALIVAIMATAAVAGLYLTCRGSGDEPQARAQAQPRAQPRAEPDRAPAAEPAAVAAQPAVATANPVDDLLMSYRGKDLGAKKRKDITPSKPYKINLYQDEGHNEINRAKVDRDRDDKWDEKWTFDGDRVTRKVAPADDENYSRSDVWDGAGWIPE